MLLLHAGALCLAGGVLATDKCRGVCSHFNYCDNPDESSTGTIRAMQRQTLIPLIVACALFMENMDSTVLATSLPAIARDIGENPLALKLAFTSYLVSLAVFIPVSGWVADRYGSRTIFAAAIVVFMGGSLLCAG